MATKWRDIRRNAGDGPQAAERRAQSMRDLKRAGDACAESDRPIYVIEAVWEPGRRFRRGWWALDVPELSGVCSQCRRLEQAPAMIEDVLEGIFDWQRGTYELRVQVLDRLSCLDL
jgi:hypothetical protein